MSEPRTGYAGSAREALDRAMGERRELQPAVIAQAKRRGWSVHWTWRSDHSPDGWPDLVLCRPPRLLIVELKREDKQPTPAQAAWLERLQLCGVEVYVWRPSDLSSGLVEAVLA